MLLLYKRPQVCDVCPNHEVTKPHTGTSLDLGSVDYCYTDILFDPPHLLYFAAQCPPGGGATPAPPLTP